MTEEKIRVKKFDGIEYTYEWMTASEIETANEAIKAEWELMPNKEDYKPNRDFNTIPFIWWKSGAIENRFPMKRPVSVNKNGDWLLVNSDTLPYWHSQGYTLG